MNELVEIELIRGEIRKIKDDLESINEENFDKLNNSVYNSVEKIKKIRKGLIKQFPLELLKKYNKELDQPIKQINLLFDNVVKKKTAERNLVASELKTFENKKKLSKYIR